MSAKKAAVTSRPVVPARSIVPAPLGRLTRFLTGPGRKPLLVFLALAALGVGWRVVWERVRPHVLIGDEYRLTAERIQITPLPAWIHADIKGEVVRDASLDRGLSALDPELPARVAHAFRLHPWVAHVEGVSVRHPATVDVKLVYRRPAVMVEVQGGVLPVDVEGVVLPKDDFSPAEARTYPRLANIRTQPRGPIGTRWGDVRVTGGAKIAAALAEHWQKLKLRRVVAPADSPSFGRDETTYELYTHASTQILWGSPPGSEASGEMTAAAKVARLVAYAAEHGSLDGPQQSSIDLRGRSEQIVPRTAAKPLPHDEASE